MKKIIILGGGTFSPIRNHLSLCAPAFGTTAKYLYENINKKINKGFLIKNNKVNEFYPYNLIIPLEDDKLIFKDIIKLFDNPIYGAFTRTLSLSLRHGIPVQYIVEQLRKDKHSDITSFSTVIARVLSKNYIPDGTKANSAEKKMYSM